MRSGAAAIAAAALACAACADPAPRRPPQTLKPPQVSFLAEQKGAFEDRVKQALIPVLKAHPEVHRAYLMSVAFGEAAPSIAACLETDKPGGQLLEQIQGGFSRAAAGMTTHLDVLFLNAEQKKRIATMAKPFYTDFVVTDTSPPAWPELPAQASQRMTQPVTGISLRSFHIIFESTTFADVASMVAQAPVRQRGDGAKLQMWVCFTRSDTSQRIWLTSSARYQRRYVDGAIAVALQGAVRATSDCPELPRPIELLQFDHDVWLGMSYEDLQRKLGRPDTMTGGYLYYTSASRAHDRDVDVTSTLALRLENNRVIAIYASHATGPRAEPAASRQ